MTNARRLLTAIALSICVAVPALRPAGAQQSRVGALRGVVVIDDSSRAPIPLADVYIAAYARFARTDAEGRFFIGDLPNGSYELRTRRLGFEPSTRSLSVNAADTVEYELALTPLAQLVSQVDVVAPPVPVTPTLTPEERHRRSSMGRFITREELEGQEDRRLSDILQRLPGLRIVRGNRAAAWVASSGFRGASSSGSGGDADACFSNIVIDRQVVYAARPNDYPFDVDRVGAYMVEEIEWYSSNSMAPVEYSSFGRNCGTLVLRLR